MRYQIDNRENADPCVNLALEEYCLKHLDAGHQYVLLYVNAPSVIVGRNQNILQEIDRRFVAAKRIQVLRRLSGGGAVYHDRGNINFSFIQDAAPGGRLQNIDSFLSPVRDSLRQMGISAHINERSDLVVGTKKISGSARFSNTRRVMVHGTLLFDTNLRALSQALSPPRNRLLTRAVQSVRQPVANVRPLLDPPVDLTAFIDRLLTGLQHQTGPMRKLSLADWQWREIYRLADEKYRSWDWTFGRTPHFSVMKNGRGKDRLLIDVHRGKIAAIADLDPDSGSGIWTELGSQLAGTRYEPDEIRVALGGIRIAARHRTMDAEQLTRAIYCY